MHQEEHHSVTDVAGEEVRLTMPATPQLLRVARLTAAGRKQLTVETTRWDKLARAIAHILRPASEESRP